MTDSDLSHKLSATDRDSSPPTNVRWRILSLMMVIAGLAHFNRISISSAGTEYIMDMYAIDKESMGLVYSSFLFVYTFCMLPGGWLLDKIGPKRALLVVCLGSALLVPLTGVVGYIQTPVKTAAQVRAEAKARQLEAERQATEGTTSPKTSETAATKSAESKGSESTDTESKGQVKGLLALLSSAGPLLLALCLIRGLLGACNAPIHPSAARGVSFWMPSSVRGIGNGLVTGAAVVGIVLTPYAFGFLMDVLGWQQAFMAAGAITCLVGCVWAYYATDHPHQHSALNQAERELLANDIAPQPAKTDLRDSLNGVTELCQNRSLVLLMLSYAAYSYVQYLFFYWQQQYFKDVLKMSNEDSRLFPTIVNIAMVLGMLNGGWLADRLQRRFGVRLGRTIPPAFGLLACAVLMILGTISMDKIWVVTCFALSMGALGISEAPYWVCAVELGERRGGLSGAFLNTVGNVVGILAPIITPIFANIYGWQGALGLASVMAVVGAVLWLGVDPAERRPVAMGNSDSTSA